MNLQALKFAVIAIAVAAFGGAAFAQTSQQTTTAPQTAPSGPVLDGASSAYILGRDDVVEVSLLGRNDFNGRARIQADGTIQLPFIGKIAAAEKTTAELADAIRKALQAGGYFSDPVAVVEVVGYASRYVTVLGAVASPGLVPINRPYRLSEVIARVGGQRADSSDHIVVTSASGEEKRFSIRDLATGDPAGDPLVKAGDKIYSPVAENFYIYGQVNSPGAYGLQSAMTVRQAIAKGGGLTESGSDKKVNVTRAGKKVKVGLDEQIQPGDVLVIGERLF